MSDGSFTTTISTADLAPAQRQQLDTRIRSEGIPVTWWGESITLDQAFESRVETLVEMARSTPAPVPGDAPAPGFVATAPPPPGPAYPSAPYPSPYPPPYPSPYPSPYPAPGYYAPRITNSNATMSLVLGIIGWVACPIASIFGVIYGRRAQDEIAASAGTQGGEGLAKAGIIISWIVIAIYGLVIAGFLIFTILFSIIGIAASST